MDKAREWLERYDKWIGVAGKDEHLDEPAGYVRSLLAEIEQTDELLEDVPGDDAELKILRMFHELDAAQGALKQAEAERKEMGIAIRHALGTLKGIYADGFVPDEEKVVNTFLVQSINRLEQAIPASLRERIEG